MRISEKSRRLFGLAAIGAALTIFLLQNVEQVYFKHGILVAGSSDANVPTLDSHSPTGYQWGQRSQILSPDGSHWVMQTQRMLAEGNLRVRSVDYDNHPYGREVHWSSSLHDWLAGLAWLWSSFSGCTVGLAVEQVAPYANPLAFVLFFLLLVPFVWRRFGAVAAGLLAFGMVTVTPFSELYGFADPDHHGLVAAFCLLSVLFLVVGGAGWVKSESVSAAVRDPSADPNLLRLPMVSAARRWFIAAGFAGAAGLWISSATQVPVLIGTGIAVLVANGWLARNTSRSASVCVAPELWRVWGASGAVASMGFYLLEYSPTHMSLRLEVNHPLYAVAWLGGGDLLCRLVNWMIGKGFARHGKDLLLAVAGGSCFLLMPAVILLTKDRTFWVADPVLWALHTDYITEFSSLFRRLGDVGARYALFIANPLPLVGLAAVMLLRSADLEIPRKAALVVALVPAMVVLALAVQQIRWMGISCALWFVVLVVVAWRPDLKRAMPLKWKFAAVGLAILVFAPTVIRVSLQGRKVLAGEISATPSDLRATVLRDLAFWLRARVGATDKTVVLSGPAATSALIYHGGFKGVGTLYWENRDGLKSMIDIFSATDDAKSKSLVAMHQITHIVIPSWDTFADQSARLAAGLRRGEQAPQGTFLARLAEGRGYPPWLRPVFYKMPLQDVLKNESVLVYEVVPEQSREEVALRHAQLLFASGNPEEAEKFFGVLLARYPSFLSAWIAAAQVQLSLNHIDAFRTSIDRIYGLIGDAEELAFDDRLNLAIVLALVNDQERARTQIRLCIETADESSLRKLSEDDLYYFFALLHELGEGQTRPELVRLGTSLLSKDLLKKLEERGVFR